MKVENRSAMIRDLIASANTSKQKSTQYIVDTLAAKGVTVSKQLIYQVKASYKKKSRRNAAKIAANARHSNNGKVRSKGHMESWIMAKNLLSSVGGDLNAAKKNLEIVAKLIS